MQEGAKLEPKEEAGAAKYPRPCGAPPKWGPSPPTWDGESGFWVDDEGKPRPADQRDLDKRAKRRSPEAQERNAKMERARKKRLKEEKAKEEEQRRVKHELEAPAGGAEGPQLQGAPPGAGAQKERTEQKLGRNEGYDTNNDLNKLLTQCLKYSITDRSKPSIINAVIKQITNLEDHCDMNKHRDIQVDGHYVVDVLELVLKELKGKDLKAKRLSYSNDLKKQLKDVLLSPLGRDTVDAMVKEATKLGPKEDEPPEKKLKTENKALRLENEQLRADLHNEQQKNADIWNVLSNTTDTNLNTPAEPMWHATNGAETCPFGLEDAEGPKADGPKAAADEPDFFNWNMPIL